jgi:hypothetical protein
MKAGSVEALGNDPAGWVISLTGAIENGRYRMFLPASTYWFTSSPLPDRYPKIESGLQIRISADTTIDFAASGHLVTGMATLGRAEPVRGANVEAHGKCVDGLEISAYDKTRGDGRFELYLPSGGYSILVRPGRKDRHITPRFLRFTVEGPKTISVDLTGVVWRGTVRDSSTRLPLRSVYVVATMTRGGFFVVSKSDGRGRFMFVLEPGQEYALKVELSNPNSSESGLMVSWRGMTPLSISTSALVGDRSRDPGSTHVALAEELCEAIRGIPW